MGRLYRSFKSRLNSLLERLLQPCNNILRGYYRFPAFMPDAWLQAFARFLGDLVWLMVNFPRLSAYRINHEGINIIFVGSERGLKWFRLSFYQDAPPQEAVQDAGRIALWKLRQQCADWLRGDIDLVVCELGRLFPRRPRAALTFAVPTSVTQVLDISGSIEDLLSGNKRKSIRARINRALKEGFAYQFSQSDADFDFFHHTLFKPYIQDRHGELALFGSYDEQHRLFKRGGLVFVTFNGEKVGGSIGFFVRDTYMDVEGGYLHRDERLANYGVNAFMTWSAIQWAKQNGAAVYDIGISNPWRSDPVFTFKRRLGTKVIPPKMLYQHWLFLANELSEPIRDHLNAKGFIAELNGRLYGVHLHLDPAALTLGGLQIIQDDWSDEGVDGVLIVSPARATDVYPLRTLHTQPERPLA